MKDQEVKTRYSFIYNELVTGSNDFIGLVAYSLYKQDKIAYVKNFEKENGRSPEPCELKDFHDMAYVRIAQYKEIAENRVASFYDSLFKAQSENLEQEYQAKLVQELKKAKPSWWAGVFQGMLGSLLFTIALGILVLSILYSQYGLKWVVKQAVEILSVP